MKCHEGTALVREVIAKIKSQGFVGVFGASMVAEEITPMPVSSEALAQLGAKGLALSPSILEWLAFDGTFFGWVDEFGEPKPSKLTELATRWFGKMAGANFRGLEAEPLALSGDCYHVPFGSETTRFVYGSAPDATGELPVLLLDVDDNPFITVRYPGIDIYLGHHSGIIELDNAAYATRLSYHRERLLGGRETVVYGDAGFPELSPTDLQRAADQEAEEQASLPEGVTPMGPMLFMLAPGAALPAGFVVMQETKNPFTGHTMRMIRRG